MLWLHMQAVTLKSWSMTMRIRTYSELRRYHTFNDRFNYLRLRGAVGRSTFGHDRYLNQRFYTSVEWRHLRNEIIARDRGLDLGVEDHEIYDKIIIHHMNPITEEDILHGSDFLFNPEYLITTTHQTHNAIHYGDENLLVGPPVERRPGDTKLW